jgi:nitric oxide synthase oxygenase domain/subunit
MCTGVFKHATQVHFLKLAVFHSLQKMGVSVSEHLLQALEYCGDRRRRESAQSLDQAFAVNRA